MPLLRLFILLAISVVFPFVGISQVQTCPDNIDFEQNSFNNWRAYTGTCCPINTPVTSGPVANRHVITSGTGLDPYGNFPVVAPGGGKYSLKLGNNVTGAQSERVRYYVHVPTNSNNFVLLFKYAVVFEDPGHAISEQPRFEVNAFDSATNDPVSCVQYSYIASSTLPGFQKVGTTDVYFKPWQTASISLAGYAGKTVALDFATGDCKLGGHFGYAYVDVICGLFQPYYNLACVGTSNLTMTAPSDFQSYQWTDDQFTTTYGTKQSLTISKPASTKKFAVILTPYPGYGCPDTLYTTVESFLLLKQKDTIICEDKPTTLQFNAQLSTSLPSTFQWTPSTGLSCTNCPNPSAFINQSISYYLTVTDQYGCTQYDTVDVTLGRQVDADIIGNIDSLCQYKSLVVADTMFNSKDAYPTWTVDDGSILGDAHHFSAKASWPTPGLKKIRIEVSTAYCTDADSVNIYIKPGPLVSFSISKYNACIDEPITIQPRQNDGLHQWTIDDDFISDTAYNPSYQLSWSSLGKKRISLIVSNPNGCVDSYDSAVVIHEIPPAKISGIINNVCVNELTTLSTPADDYYYYEWAPQIAFQNNNASEVKANFQRNSFVFLKVTNQWGCSAIDTEYITTQRCCDIYTPDAFTPNGDGKNDNFHILTGGFHFIHTFIVKNRWGKTIFETNDEKVGWDGTFNGVPQDPDTYFYYIKYSCGNDKVFVEKKGNVILLR